MTSSQRIEIEASLTPKISASQSNGAPETLSKTAVFDQLNSETVLDYGVYLKTSELFECQKPLDDLANSDELQFQIVHQIEELWFKLLVNTLCDISSCLNCEHTQRATILFKRCHRILRLMISQLDLLETMSPKEYQVIRLQLGNGSGQESPGFRTIRRLFAPLWAQYEYHYLTTKQRTLEQVYDSEFTCDDAYLLAEDLAELDELFQKFRLNHVMLIQRSIGIGSKSLKGRPVEMLWQSARKQQFPALWRVRDEMTDSWGGTYGVTRDSIRKEK